MWVKQTYPMDGEREGNMGKLFFFVFFFFGGGVVTVKKTCWGRLHVEVIKAIFELKYTFIFRID